MAHESPDWLIINMPRAMKERHPNVKTANLVAYTCQLLARLIKAQAQARRRFVMYGNPLSDLWEPEYAVRSRVRRALSGVVHLGVPLV